MTPVPNSPKTSRGHWWWLAGTAALVAAAAGGCYAWAARPLPATPKPFVFRDDFESGAKTEDLFPKDASRWSGTQRDGATATGLNLVALTTERTHSGRQALKCVAAPSEGNNVSKADIERTGLKFTKGDHVWFSGYFWLPSDTDASLTFMWDLETTKLRNSPGRRLFLQDGEFFASDLGKWWTGKKFRQPLGAQVKFPKDKWVQVKIHLVLSEGNDGRMQVWQDGQKVLDGTGKTLPRASTIYDRMQVGVTANGRPDRAQTLYVDDVVLSNRPI